MIKKALLGIFLFLFCNYQGLSQSPELIITRTADFEINGIGDHEAWDQTSWTEILQTTQQNHRYYTKVKVLYSETGIYFLFECEDDYITSTITEDFGDLYNEDVVEVFFWTDEDHPFYFEYELSPSNYELPIFVPNVEGDFFGWKPWHYEGERRTRHATFIYNEEGETKSWTAEFFIPFALLKPMANVPPQPGTKWRANMYRLDYDHGQTRWTWRPIRTNFHDYERFGTFIFK